MKRLLLATLALSPILPAAAIAQVKIAQQYKVQERIDAKVENVGNQPITFCVEMGQTSSNGSEIESTPSPFWVQRSRSGKWGTLLIGPDVGSFRGAVILEARGARSQNSAVVRSKNGEVGSASRRLRVLRLENNEVGDRTPPYFVHQRPDGQCQPADEMLG